MAKAKKSVFFCQNCGHEESKWLGQCPMCKEWNTFVEEKITVSSGGESGVVRSGKEKGFNIVPVSYTHLENDQTIILSNVMHMVNWCDRT